MTEQAMLSAISTVGFPIVAFLLMYRFARDTVKENTAAIRDLHDELQRRPRRATRRVEEGSD